MSEDIEFDAGPSDAPLPMVVVEDVGTSLILSPKLRGYIVQAVGPKGELGNLYGRDVSILFRPDTAGKRNAKRIADHLARRGDRVRVVGWPNEPLDTMPPEQVEALIAEGMIVAAPAKPKAQGPTLTVTGDTPSISEDAKGLLEICDVEVNKGGIPTTNLDNVCRVLDGWAGFGELAWYDEFHDRVFTNFQGPVREWTDTDTSILARFLQRKFGMAKLSIETTRQAIELHARENKRNEPKDWTESLEWDGQERIGNWLYMYLGADDNEYTRAVSRNWWVSMLARTYRPGIKVDTMLILQGEQSKGKSTTFEIIGGKWYGIATADANDAKAFGETLQGKLLMEMAELVNFTKADAEAVKRLLSTPVDRYRESYGHYAADRPRRGVLVGTTNKEAFLQDETGARRFWPVAIRQLNHGALVADREQLFAEAVTEYKKWDASADPLGWQGHSDALGWWRMPASAAEHQEAVRQHDEIEERMSAWLADRTDGASLAEIWTDALGNGLTNFERHQQLRVAKAMRAVGWYPAKPQSVNGKTVRLWYPMEAPF